MKSSVCVFDKNRNASLRIVLSIVTIAPLWLMLITPDTSVNGQATSSPADWTQFHRDNMQRWNPYETLLGVGNVGGLQVKWKTVLDGQPSVFPQASPAVVNGVVYIGSEDGNLYALNAGTGAKLWSYTTGAEVFSSPAVANGVVYIGSGDFTTSVGNVYALNASTGAKLWSYATVGGALSSPAVANGIVYIGSDAGEAGTGNVYALNASTGAKLWSFNPVGGVFSSPAVANGVVYFGSDNSSVYALDAGTGAFLWRFATGSEVFSSPAVANGVVYVGSGDGHMYALDASTGAKLWSFAPAIVEGSFVGSSPAVANGLVYFGDQIGNVFALNAKTGAELWSYTAKSYVLSSPAVANGVVYIGSGNDATGFGNVYALNASTGALLWSYATGVQEYSSPSVVDGVVYVRDGDASGAYVHAFALGSADLFLRIRPTLTTIHQGDELTYAFPVWNLGPNNAVHEVLNTQVPAGTVFDYIRISGTPGLGTCTHTPYLGAGPIPIVCHENSAMAPNTTWTVRLTVKVTAPAGTVITENAATMADTPDPNMANNTATASLTVVP